MPIITTPHMPYRCGSCCPEIETVPLKHPEETPIIVEPETIPDAVPVEPGIPVQIPEKVEAYR
jgi:hypothetical protein